MKAQSPVYQIKTFLAGLCLSLLVSSIAFGSDTFRLAAIIHYLLPDDAVVVTPPESCPESKIGVCYDIVYVRQPRFGDRQNTTWPEVFHPGRMDPGADLVLLQTNGTEDILVDCGVCGVTDPFVSFDG